MDGELFQIHRGKFELDPGGNRGQPSIWRITHGVFFLRVGKDALNGLRTQCVGFLANRRMPKVLRSFYVVVPDVARHGLCVLLIFGAAFADRTAFTSVTLAFVLPVALTVGGGIAQNLVLRAENAVVILIVDIFVPGQVPLLRHRPLVGQRWDSPAVDYLLADPRRFVARVGGDHPRFWIVLDQAIIDRAGRVLIARRTRLEDFHIDALKKMGVTGIYTCEGTEDVKPAEADQTQQLPEPLQKKYDQVKVKDPAKVQISESVRSRVAQGVQYLYQDTQSADFTNASRSITDDLLKAIEDNDAVAVDIGALKVSDEYTFKHSVDVATMSMIVARKYGLDDQQVYEIGIAGLLHDIGKSKIPNEILNKAARLTDEEFAIMKQHSVYGYRILQPKEDLSTEIKLGVLQHHEKINGKGYPMGVTGDKIDLFARLISISDIYDALVTERPYKKPFSPRDAVEMIMSMTEELDINVMRCFLESVILYPVGTDVALSNGETARVVENIPNAVLRPKVLGLTTGRVYDLANDVKCANIIIL